MDEESGYCVGCARTLGEIAEWGMASDARKEEILASLPPRRDLISDAFEDWR